MKVSLGLYYSLLLLATLTEISCMRIDEWNNYETFEVGLNAAFLSINFMGNS
jgi:hypothetical protein